MRRNNINSAHPAGSTLGVRLEYEAFCKTIPDDFFATLAASTISFLVSFPFFGAIVAPTTDPMAPPITAPIKTLSSIFFFFLVIKCGYLIRAVLVVFTRRMTFILIFPGYASSSSTLVATSFASGKRSSSCSASVFTSILTSLPADIVNRFACQRLCLIVEGAMRSPRSHRQEEYSRVGPTATVAPNTSRRPQC